MSNVEKVILSKQECNRHLGITNIICYKRKKKKKKKKKKKEERNEWGFTSLSIAKVISRQDRNPEAG